MAGDWIKFESTTPDKPEVWGIATELGIDPDAVVGKLLRVWGWFDQHTETGNAPSVTKMLLDRKVGVTGFCEAVINAGWMTDDGAHIALPNFTMHNGKTAKNRALTAKRVAEHKRKSNESSNDASVNGALPREEKRREEKNIQKESEPGVPQCPVEKIIDIYKTTANRLPGVRVVPDAVKGNIRARWRQDEKFQSLEFWEKLFAYCENHPFLSGQVDRPDKPPWRASLAWIVKQSNFAKIVNEEYER